MPVDARRFVRKMRGGAQAHLLEASDGRFYVVKFRNNPQHQRILVNEWIATAFLEYLGIAAPPAALVRVSQDFLDENPEVHFQLGRGRIAVEAGWHFGSQYPGDPLRSVVYDFLPDALLDRIENLADFRGVLAFDKWMGNADARQSIFFRARLRESRPANPAPAPAASPRASISPTSISPAPIPPAPISPAPISAAPVRAGLPHPVSPTPVKAASSPPLSADPQRLGFVVQMMDNGYVFEGPHWRLPDAPLMGLYFRPLVYRSVRGLADFEPWLSRIRHFPEEVVDQAVKQIPESWLEGDREALDHLLDRLLRRRTRVEDLLLDCRAARPDHFPEWRS